MLLSEQLTNNLSSPVSELETFVKELQKMLRLDFDLEAYIKLDKIPKYNAETRKSSDGLIINVFKYGTEVHVADVDVDEEDPEDYVLRPYIHTEVDGQWSTNLSDKTEFLSTCTAKRFYNQYVLPAAAALKAVRYNIEVNGRI